jgi:hypothetical protein
MRDERQAEETREADEMTSGGRTVIHVAIENQAAGLMAVADAPREGAKETVNRLRSLGIEPVMLTGDSGGGGAVVASVQASATTRLRRTAHVWLFYPGCRQCRAVATGAHCFMVEIRTCKWRPVRVVL